MDHLGGQHPARLSAKKYEPEDKSRPIAVQRTNQHEIGSSPESIGFTNYFDREIGAAQRILSTTENLEEK